MTDCLQVKIRARASREADVATFVVAARALAGSQERAFVTLDQATLSSYLGMLTVELKGGFDEYLLQLREEKRKSETGEDLKVRVTNLTSKGKALVL